MPRDERAQLEAQHTFQVRIAVGAAVNMAVYHLEWELLLCLGPGVLMPGVLLPDDRVHIHRLHVSGGYCG